MTIAEKSTADSKDYAQFALDVNPIMTITEGGVFTCYCAGGKDKNIDIHDENGVQISDGAKYNRYSTTEFTESTLLSVIKTDFLDWLNNKEFYPSPVVEVLTLKT